MVPNFNDYDAVTISSSAGKDSAAMLAHVVALADKQGYSRDRLRVIHADLGRMEWEGTGELARKQADHYGLQFHVVTRKQDLLDHIEERGMFPSSTCRYCTSDHKRGQINKVYTLIANEYRPGRGDIDAMRFTMDREIGLPVAKMVKVRKPVKLLSCIGFRSEESPARAKREPFTTGEEYTGKYNVKGTVIDTWYPIHSWKLDQVWETTRAAGLPMHYAYDLGMPRLSCVFCIFAPKAALLLAGKHNPELLAQYVAVEEKIGHTFKADLSLKTIQAELDAGAEVGAVGSDDATCWNM